tara:strand:+ start:7620 stop:7904 length:285 start_codon:yes stop_codon:yes gene_type:complete
MEITKAKYLKALEVVREYQNHNETPVFTFSQMTRIMDVTRSWTLNHPSGKIPYLPIFWNNEVGFEDNVKISNDSMPPLKEPHPIISALMKIKVI